MDQLRTLMDKVDEPIQRLAAVVDNPRIPYETLVIWLGTLQTWFELYVARRQKKVFARPAPPVELKDHLKAETYQKATAYGSDKLSFAFAKTIYSYVLGISIIKLGIYPWAWDTSARLMQVAGVAPNRTIVQSLIWTSILTLVTAIPGIPWSYYNTFVVEQKHGFNKSTKKLFFTDLVKSYVLMGVIGLPILAGFLKIIDLAGKSFVPALMLFMIVVQLILQIIFPIFIQPLFNKFTPLPEGDVRTRVEALASKLKFPLKHLYVIDGSKRSSHSNAYFYGLPWSKQIVLFDTLLERSNPPEVEAVLAHELGHWKLSHVTRLLLISQGHLFFTLIIFSIFGHNKALFSAFGFDPKLAVESPSGGPQPVIIGFILYQLLFEPLDTFVQFGMNALTRKYEYEADDFAVNLGYKNELGSALIKLHIDNLSAPASDPLYSAYHHSHPTLVERLRAMDDSHAKVAANGSKPEAKKDL